MALLARRRDGWRLHDGEPGAGLRARPRPSPRCSAPGPPPTPSSSPSACPTCPAAVRGGRIRRGLRADVLGPAPAGRAEGGARLRRGGAGGAVRGAARVHGACRSLHADPGRGPRAGLPRPAGTFRPGRAVLAAHLPLSHVHGAAGLFRRHIEQLLPLRDSLGRADPAECRADCGAGRFRVLDRRAGAGALRRRLPGGVRAAGAHRLGHAPGAAAPAAAQAPAHAQRPAAAAPAGSGRALRRRAPDQPADRHDHRLAAADRSRRLAALCGPHLPVAARRGRHCARHGAAAAPHPHAGRRRQQARVGRDEPGGGGRDAARAAGGGRPHRHAPGGRRGAVRARRLHRRGHPSHRRGHRRLRRRAARLRAGAGVAAGLLRARRHAPFRSG